MDLVKAILFAQSLYICFEAIYSKNKINSLKEATVFGAVD